MSDNTCTGEAGEVIYCVCESPAEEVAPGDEQTDQSIDPILTLHLALRALDVSVILFKCEGY